MKKIDKKILEGLKDTLKPEELSTNKGRFERNIKTKLTKKDKRHSGRVGIYIHDEDYPFQEVFYDDWRDWRDSCRSSWEEGTTELKSTLKKRKKIKKIWKKLEKMYKN